MALTYRAAADLILGRLNEEWVAGAQAAVGGAYLPELVWEPIERKNLPADEITDDQGVAWARAYLRHERNKQVGMGSDGNTRLFTRHGYVLVQCFAPFRDGSGYGLAQDVAEVAVKAYEGKRAGAVRFRDPVQREIGKQGPWYQIDVTIQIQWDQVR